MRYSDLFGINTVLSIEESRLLSDLDKTEFDERDHEIARKLRQKGLIYRTKDGKYKKFEKML